MKHSTATFSSAMSNILPAFAFLMAWIFRLEEVSFKSLHGLAKVLGTLITVGGAIILTLVKGPSLSLPWDKQQHPHQQSQSHSDDKNLVHVSSLSLLVCFHCFANIYIKVIPLSAPPLNLDMFLG